MVLAWGTHRAHGDAERGCLGPVGVRPKPVASVERAHERVGVHCGSELSDKTSALRALHIRLAMG